MENINEVIVSQRKNFGVRQVTIVASLLWIRLAMFIAFVTYNLIAKPLDNNHDWAGTKFKTHGFQEFLDVSYYRLKLMAFVNLAVLSFFAGGVVAFSGINDFFTKLNAAESKETSPSLTTVPTDERKPAAYTPYLRAIGIAAVVGSVATTAAAAYAYSNSISARPQVLPT